MKTHLIAGLVGALIVTSCDAPSAPEVPDNQSPVGLTQGVNGTVEWIGIEGGFWAIRTTDGRTLDPHSSLPAGYRVDGLRVHVVARALEGVACFHMAGIIVEITSISAR